MGIIGAYLGYKTGAGVQNTAAMVEKINAGKTWGSKAFLESAQESILHRKGFKFYGKDIDSAVGLLVGLIMGAKEC